jgi:hypothetical protein
VSAYGSEKGPGARQQDPVWRFIVGCAVVVGGLAAIVVVAALLIGWRLARDEAPGRPLETFLVGDEAHYWCLDLKPQDAGLAALFARFDEINDATRRKVLRGTFLESIPLPHRGARLDDLAPLTFELSTSFADRVPGGPLPAGWAARATFSHGLFRMRAALKVMSFLASRDANKGETHNVDGIAVTEIHDKSAGFAVATVGNRVVVASDTARIRTVLRTAQSPPAPALPEVLALHDAIKLPGEDAWAFYSNRRPGSLEPPLDEGGAIASFDVNESDELAFRVVVSEGGAVEGVSDFAGAPADCSAVASRFLPGLPVSAITIDGQGARPFDRGSKEFSGRIAGLSTRLAELLGRVTELRRSGTPFASPTPPSLPASGDPRNETPAGPTHEGTPTPRR